MGLGCKDIFLSSMKARLIKTRLFSRRHNAVRSKQIVGALLTSKELSSCFCAEKNERLEALQQYAQLALLESHYID